MIEMGLKVITEIMISIEHYNTLGGYINQLDSKQYDSLNEYYQKMLKYSRDGKFVDNGYMSHWGNINVHIVKHMWGNTSGGWQGIGGSAITESYTVIIDSVDGDAIFVYYGGKLAYIAKNNDKLTSYRIEGYKYLPGLNSCKDTLDLIYFKR